MGIAMHEEQPSSSFDVDALYAAHATRLHRLVSRRVGDRHLAEDIVQETFLRAYRFQNRLDPSRPAWPWLRTIALRLAANATELRHFEKEDLVAEPTMRPTSTGPAEHVERDESRATLIEILASLPERQRRLLVLREMYGFRFEELAASEGTRATALRMASSRARDAMRRHALMSRLGAIAPIGWLVQGVRRLRKVVASAGTGTVPLGSVVTAALVVAVGLSVSSSVPRSVAPPADAPIDRPATITPSLAVYEPLAPEERLHAPSSASAAERDAVGANIARAEAVDAQAASPRANSGAPTAAPAPAGAASAPDEPRTDEIVRLPETQEVGTPEKPPPTLSPTFGVNFQPLEDACRSFDSGPPTCGALIPNEPSATVPLSSPPPPPPTEDLPADAPAEPDPGLGPVATTL